MKTFVHKIVLLLAVSLALWVLGCDKAGPVDSLSSLHPGEAQKPQLIKLWNTNSLSKLVTVTKLISAKDGGTLTLDWDNGLSGSAYASVRLRLTFPNGALSQDTQISMTIDDQNLGTSVDVQFAPHGVMFLKPATLDVDADGLDLSGIPDNAKVKFYYVNNGVYEAMQVGGIKVNYGSGSLNCKDASIPHFSRYAFGY